MEYSVYQYSSKSFMRDTIFRFDNQIRHKNLKKPADILIFLFHFAQNKSLSKF